MPDKGNILIGDRDITDIPPEKGESVWCFRIMLSGLI